MADKPILKAGPFYGVQASADPYYLEQPYGALASNVDISYRYGSFSSAMGRGLLGTLTIPSGYTFQCVAPFVSFTGDNPISVVRLFVFSAVKSGSTPIQGYFNPSTGITTTFTYCNPFTQAVQFGSALWTNGGNKVILKSDGTMLSDDWQIQVPAALSYNIFATTVTQSGSAENATYTYAITVRRALSWTVQGSATPFSFYPDLDTYQESSPVFTTQITTTAGQQPAISYPSTQTLPVQGITNGQQQYYGALYRATNLNPTFQFVDYLINLPTGTGADGNPCFIDTAAYSTIQNNAYLMTHHDPPPIIGQVYPGAVFGNSAPNTLIQQQQQQAFTYSNPTFVAKHKNRLWAFTLYPANAIGSTPLSPRLSLQPQLWCSDLGTPWSFNDDPAQNQVQIIGPEDTPGNNSVDNSINTNSPWEPGILEDTPMGLATTGSYLVALKSQSTWIITGDSPSEFIPRKAFNIGCVSSNSIVEAEGGVFWLAPQGVYFFDGGAPQYIGEDVRGLIEGLSWADIQAAVGSYQDRTFYLSFPNITLCYYAPSQKWYTRPYGATAAVFSSYNQNQLIFANGSQLQIVNANAGNDLGVPVVSQWTGQLTDSESPGQLKQYNYIIVRAPVQLGTVTCTLNVDAGAPTAKSFSVTFDLNSGNNAHVARVPIGVKGYTAQLTIVTQTNEQATAPISIREVLVTGDLSNALNPTQTTDMLNQTLNGTTIFPHV